MLHTCNTPLILGLGMLRQEDIKFEAWMGNMVRLCFKKENNNRIHVVGYDSNCGLGIYPHKNKLEISIC